MTRPAFCQGFPSNQRPRRFILWLWLQIIPAHPQKRGGIDQPRVPSSLAKLAKSAPTLHMDRSQITPKYLWNHLSWRCIIPWRSAFHFAPSPRGRARTFAQRWYPVDLVYYKSNSCAWLSVGSVLLFSIFISKAYWVLSCLEMGYKPPKRLSY